MELEELTKTQIIFLVLLVSFVTSIATGIVTVSLLAQAPPAITQTVNRIVERTVETVVPAEGQQASVVTKETTVVVKEDDLITKSISESFGKIVRIHEGTSTSSPIIALGAVTGAGAIVTDLAMVAGEHAVSAGTDGFRFVVSAKFPDLGIAFMTATGTTPTTGAFKIVDSSSLKLGQTAIALFGARSDKVGIGSVSGMSKYIETTLDATLTPGTPLITIFGELAGISTSVSRTVDRGAFVAMSDVTALIEAQTAATSTTPTN